MKQKRLVAALLTLVLLAGLTGCARKSRRPALPAAPLQSTFKQDEADLGQGETASLQSAPVMKREAAGTAQAMAPEQTTEELLEAFLQPIEKADAFYQDYTVEHRAAYKKLRQRPEEVIALVLPELLENTAALECYSDDTSRTTLLYCLLKDTLKDETFCWDSDSYRWLSDMLAEYIQFASWHALQGDEAYFDEYAPLMGFSVAVMRSKPALRLNMTPCEPMTNAQALTNAKQVFAAALEGKDAERFGFDAWPENAANGFDFTTNWTLSQNEQGEVTLTAVDPDTKEKAVLTYTPNAAEMHSLLSGYGTLTLTKPDGEPISLRSQNADAAFSPVTNASPIQDYEMVLENGVEIGMDYNTVLALIGPPNQVWSDTMAGMGMERLGVMYDFHYDENLVMRLHNISFRFAEDTSTGITSALPAARGIALGEAMQSVFSKMPAYDTTLKKWAVQEIYGWADPSGGTATLSFVADSIYTLDILTPGGRCFNITFARIDHSVKWMDVS